MGPRTRLEGLAAPLVVVLAVAALYAQTAGHEFVEYDTGLYLTANPHVLPGLSLEGLRWAFTSFDAANWHPLTWLSHMLDVSLFGLEPAGHLLENAAWHAANGLLVLALFTRLGLSRTFAFAAALAFAIHPLRAESVAWIAERKDLLAAFFGLASLVAWIGWSRERAAWKLAAALALYACSLMSKPMLVTLPCLLVLLEFGVLGRRSARPRREDLATLGFVALALAACVLAVAAQSAGGAVRDLEQWPLALRLENALDAYVWYLVRTLWPGTLAFHYPLDREALGFGAVLFDAALLSALSWAAWRVRPRAPLVLVGWLWFLGTLVPVIGIVQVGVQAHADRYTYLPGLGLLLALASLVERVVLPRVPARALAALGLLAVLALGWRSALQIATWRDTEKLARHALEVTRENAVACELLGDWYTNQGRSAEALPLLREAARLSPNDPQVLANLGSALLRANRPGEARAPAARACELAPGRWQNWSLLGALELVESRPAEALAALDRALALEQGHAGTWLNRARALEALGRVEEARGARERALRLAPVPGR